MTGIQTNQHFRQQNNQIFMYFQHNILLHATAHIIDEFIPKPFLTIQIILYILGLRPRKFHKPPSAFGDI